MKDLILHLLNTNAREIEEKSLANCHCKGVNSIMLLSAPEKTIRLFVAMANHELWLNTPKEYKQGMSVGFHAHHCDLTLSVVKGEVLNWTITDNEEETGFYLNRFYYHSQIKEGKTQFEYRGKIGVETKNKSILRAGDSEFMLAKDMHTIGIHKGHSAAWFVFEGKEDATYQPWCYSNKFLNDEDYSELYKPMTMQQIKNTLKFAGVI